MFNLATGQGLLDFWLILIEAKLSKSGIVLSWETGIYPK